MSLTAWPTSYCHQCTFIQRHPTYDVDLPVTRSTGRTRGVCLGCSGIFGGSAPSSYTQTRTVRHLNHFAIHTSSWRFNRLGSNPLRATQSVTLTGLGLPYFDEAVLAALKVHGLFEDTCGQQLIWPWEPRREREHNTLTISNRYYSSASEQTNQQIVPFTSSVDPLQVLQTAVASAIHTTDNQVLYYERVPNGDK